MTFLDAILLSAVIFGPLLLLDRYRRRRMALLVLEDRISTPEFKITFSESAREKGFDKVEFVFTCHGEGVFIIRTDPITRVSDYKLFHGERKFERRGVAHGDLRSPLARIHRKLVHLIPARKGGLVSR